MVGKRRDNKPGRPSSRPSHESVTHDSTAQSGRFVETARELGCDEDEAAFRDKLRMIARQKPNEPSKEKK